MTKDSLIELCNHICERQDKYGPEEGFRFKSYFDGKEMVEAEYGTREDEKRTAARSNKKQKERKGKQKKSKKGSEKINNALAYPVLNDQQGNVMTSNQYEPQIDPLLLGDVGTYRETPKENGTNCEGRYIDDAEMQKLIANGHPHTIPINGPNDGLPRYYIPAAASLTTNPITELDMIPDPGPRRTQRVPKERKSTKRPIPNVGAQPKMTTRSQNKKRSAKK